MQFPNFGFRSTSHVQLTPDDRPHVDDGLISTAWNAGTLHVQYVGLKEVSKSASETIGKTMWQFATECQLMVVLYAGVLNSRETIQSQLCGDTSRDAPFVVSDNDKDGCTRAIWAWLPQGKVFDAFSDGGEFEKTYAKAFVVFTYQLWEEFARPRIAQALNTEHKDVQSDLMGEWRHLRNWLVHPDEKTEKAYFKNARLLAKISGNLRRGQPEVKSDMVFPMMGYLNSLHVIVNPDGLSPALEITALDPNMERQISELSEPDMSLLPIWRGFNPPADQES